MQARKWIVAGVFLTVWVCSSFGGSLNPPAPPKTGTMKPLNEVEPRTGISSVPFTISQGGSYYLTKNLSCPVGNAITVNTDDVTINLCGFVLSGSETGQGILIEGRRNVEIRNGTITGFNSAIYNDDGACSHCRVLGIRAIGNSYAGIYLGGGYHEIWDCVVSDTGGTGSSRFTLIGIMGGDTSLVAHNTVVRTGRQAANSTVSCIAVNSGSVLHNTIHDNGTSASFVYGISVSSAGGVVEGNRVSRNGNGAGSMASGITVGDSCRVVDNWISSNGVGAVSNTVYGIQGRHNNTVSGNSVINNGTSTQGTMKGIYLQSRNTVANNLVNGNNGPGISTSDACGITGNTVASNNGAGITTAKACRIADNTVTGNGDQGIYAGDNAAISGNTVESNLTEGITAGDHVTITNNTVTGNAGSGIYCTGGTISRNTVSLNNTAGIAGKGGIALLHHSQVRENTLEGNAKNNMYISGYRNSVEFNVLSGSDAGIRFASSGNYYANNRATANGINYISPAGNTDGGGNVSF